MYELGFSDSRTRLSMSKFFQLAHHIWLLSARWDCLDIEHSTAAQTRVYTSSFLCEALPPSIRHTLLVQSLTFCQFTPSQGFKPIVLNPDSQKAGTVGGLHNTSLSSPPIGAWFVQLGAHRKQGRCRLKNNHESL